jgi:hypothetical protein
VWAIVFLLSLLPVSNAVTWEGLVFFPEQLDELGENFYFPLSRLPLEEFMKFRFLLSLAGRRKYYG